MTKPNIDVYVIDATSGILTDRSLWLDGFLTLGELYVSSVSNMVSKCSAQAAAGRIGTLFISGHGDVGYQAVGCGRARDVTSLRSLQLDRATGALLGGAAIALGSLKPKLAANAIVTLGGCLVGRGTQLLAAVSDALGGVAVQAACDYQRPLVPGLEGTVVRCAGSSCRSLSGHSWWRSPGR